MEGAQSPRVARYSSHRATPARRSSRGAERRRRRGRPARACCGSRSRERIDLTIVGPEGPLVLGITDEFSAAGLRCFGPSRDARGSRAPRPTRRTCCAQHRSRPPAYATFTRESFDALGSRAACAARGQGGRSGRGQGRGDLRDARPKPWRRPRRCSPGASAPRARRVVVEECLEGEEATFIAHVRREHVLPLARRRTTSARRRRQGPNTGGMGAYSPGTGRDAAVHERASAR